MEILLIYLGVGIAAGLIAGLFGVGGGLIVVPALVLAFSAQGFDSAVLTHMAVGTSLATIIITSLSSIRAHHLKGAVDWPLFRQMAPAIFVGSWLGGITADYIPGAKLQLLIGVFAIAIGIRMWLSRRAPAADGEEQIPAAPVVLGASGLIGWASAIFGIGGGSLTVPLLSRFRVRMQRAVATSAACGLPIAVSGTLSFMVQGWDNPALPAWSSGYVYWPAFLGIVITSSVMAKVGAKLAHSLSPDILKKLFGLLLFLIGLRFLWANI